MVTFSIKITILNIYTSYKHCKTQFNMHYQKVTLKNKYQSTSDIKFTSSEYKKELAYIHVKYQITSNDKLEWTNLPLSDNTLAGLWPCLVSQISDTLFCILYLCSVIYYTIAVLLILDENPNPTILCKLAMILILAVFFSYFSIQNC